MDDQTGILRSIAVRRLGRIAAWLGLLAAAGGLGCGSDETDQPNAASRSRQVAGAGAGRGSTATPRADISKLPGDRAGEAAAGQHTGVSPPPRTLADLLSGQSGDDHDHDWNLEWFGLPEIDEAKVRGEGIRRIQGEHVALYTDLESAPELDELTEVFDRAVPIWCEYFQIEPEDADDWMVIGSVMKDKERFARCGLLPPDLPPFPHGYQRGSQMWVYEQASAYYRRHLVLHEGTHIFMNRFLGGTGPPWYMEGAAELLGTHLWKDGQLQLRHFPQDKLETPHWGRIKIIKDELEAGRALNLKTVMDSVESNHAVWAAYGWCWAAAAFLDGHPEYGPTFRALPSRARDHSLRFSSRYRQELAAEWPHVERQWQLFLTNLEYGYDLSREAFERRPSSPLPAEGATAKVATDRGWQSSGIWLEAGANYSLTASGRYQVARDQRIWWCESNGVTLRYHQGRPLGVLLAAVCDDQQSPLTLTPLATPQMVGAGAAVRPEQAGVLYLRINESSPALADNVGHLSVQVKRQLTDSATRPKMQAF